MQRVRGGREGACAHPTWLSACSGVESAGCDTSALANFHVAHADQTRSVWSRRVPEADPPADPAGRPELKGQASPRQLAGAGLARCPVLQAVCSESCYRWQAR